MMTSVISNVLPGERSSHARTRAYNLANCPGSGLQTTAARRAPTSAPMTGMNISAMNKDANAHTMTGRQEFHELPDDSRPHQQRQEHGKRGRGGRNHRPCHPH